MPSVVAAVSVRISMRRAAVVVVSAVVLAVPSMASITSVPSMTPVASAVATPVTSVLSRGSRLELLVLVFHVRDQILAKLLGLVNHAIIRAAVLLASVTVIKKKVKPT